MPLDRLRRVLGSSFQITVDSSASVATRVNGLARPQMNPKTAVPFAPLAGSNVHPIRPIDLLRKIGEVTTPRWVNLARLSASWATRRYFWCIHEYSVPTSSRPFCLSTDARRMERHQKTLLSDEFGVGFAALLMEQLLGASRTVDVQFALADPAEYFDVRRGPSKRTPDYLMWAPGGEIYIVECKGCQTSKSAAMNQLRRGMEQVPTINIPGTVTPELVIATHLAKSRTTVYVQDPPKDEQKDLRPSKDIEKRTPREYTVADTAAFRTKLHRGTNLQRLRWISQHATAATLESSVGFRPSDRPAELPNARLTTVDTEVATFTGVETPIAPEFGFNGPTLFRGIEQDHLRRMAQGDLESESAFQQAVPNDPAISVSADGICLLVRNLDIPNIGG